MKLDFNRKWTTIAVYAFLVIVGSVLFLAMIMKIQTLTGYLSVVWHILSPFLYGFIIAYFLNPLVKVCDEKLYAKLPLKRSFIRILSITTSFLVALFIIFVFLRIVAPTIMDSIATLIYNVQGYVQALEEWGNHLFETLPENEFVTHLVNKGTSYLEELLNRSSTYLIERIPAILEFTTNLTKGIFNFVVGLVIAVYMLTGKERFFAQIKKILYAFFKEERVHSIIAIAHDSHQTFGGFIMGKLLDSLIIGILCFIATSLMDLPFAMLISFIVGVTNVIPFFGPFIGAIPSAIIVLISEPGMTIWFILFVFLLQQFDGNILGPRILGESTGLSAFWVMFAILLFGGLFNFVGMILGVPFFAVIYSLIRAYLEERLKRRGLPTATAEYASAENPLLFEKEDKKASRKQEQKKSDQ